MHWSPYMEESMHEPTFQSCLYPFIGRKISVQTVRGSVTGRLYQVHYDHILIKSGGAPFFIRTQQILWAVPILKSKKHRMYPIPYW